MILAENLTKRYGTQLALNRVSFHIRPGEAVALWGANGAGKTTTLRCLLGVHAFEGRLEINGVDVARHGKTARAFVGYVPQETRFYDLSVRETMHFYARLKKVPVARVDRVLDAVQLAAHGQKPVAALSGGMKQRLALAVALLADPPILILDEPTANLDMQAQRDFLQMVRGLNHEGKTVVFSSHRIEEVLALASRVLVLDGGRLAQQCAPGELADQLTFGRWLRIWVADAQREDTLRLLEAQGFTFSPNGHTVYVQLRGGNKMAALRSLEAANIEVQDFELVDGSSVSGEGPRSWM